MEIEYTLEAREDLDYWLKTNNGSILRRIRQLVEAISESPYRGIGKPEALKHGLTGCWSRRLDHKHRIVYQVDADKVYILSMKGHYQ